MTDEDNLSVQMLAKYQHILLYRLYAKDDLGSDRNGDTSVSSTTEA